MLKQKPMHQYQLASTTSLEPFTKVAVDLFGPLPLSSKNNKYSFSYSGYVSRYVDLYAVPDNKQNTIANIIFEKYITRHGIPQRVCF